MITLYGAMWCADCKRSRDYLDSQSVQYTYIDIDSVAGAADMVAKLNDGMKIIPTILFADGTILREPTNKELSAQLETIDQNL